MLRITSEPCCELVREVDPAGRCVLEDAGFNRAPRRVALIEDREGLGVDAGISELGKCARVLRAFDA